MYQTIAALHRRSLVGHGDELAGIAHHKSPEVLIRGKRVRAASNHIERQAALIGILNGLDHSHTRIGLNKTGDATAHANGGDVCKGSHAAHPTA